MAKTASQNKRSRKKSSGTGSYMSSYQEYIRHTPFTMQTRSREKAAKTVAEINSTPLQASGSGPQNVEVNDSSDRHHPLASLSVVIDSSSEDDTAIVDTFQWNADEQSESALVRLLQDMNSDISDALVPILHKLKTRLRFYENRPNVFDTANHNITKNLDPSVERPLVQELYAARRAHSRFIFGDEVIEALLQDAICVTLYERFFAGTIFFGILHTRDHKSALDTMFDYLLKQDKWSVAQRWRSLASSAPTLEEQVIKDTLDKIAMEVATNVRKAIDIVYPTSSTNFNRFINELVKTLEKPIQKIVDMAHEISIAFQRDVVTSRLKVILSLPQGNVGVNYLNDYLNGRRGLASDARIDQSRLQIDTEQVLGTVSFGLLAIRPEFDNRPNAKVLLAPTVTTVSLFSVDSYL